MQKSLKIIFLSLTLIVPALVYIFLKSFGENRYALPVFYEEQLEIQGCESIEFPYKVELEGISDADHAFTFVIISSSDKTKSIRDLSRIIEKFDNGALILIGSNVNPTKDSEALLFSNPELLKIERCHLMLPQNFDSDVELSDKAVLLDNLNRIRGYYDISQFDELERTEVEIKILLQEYTYQDES